MYMTIPIYFYQRTQQISIFDKFWQDFRNNQILWKFDKSLTVQKQQQQQSHSSERFRNTCSRSKIGALLKNSTKALLLSVWQSWSNDKSLILKCTIYFHSEIGLYKSTWNSNWLDIIAIVKESSVGKINCSFLKDICIL